MWKVIAYLFNLFTSSKRFVALRVQNEVCIFLVNRQTGYYDAVTRKIPLKKERKKD